MPNSDLISIIAPALVIGLMIAFTHAPFGIEVLRRGIIFIDLAVAQIAGLGFVIVNTFAADASLWISQALAFAFAIIAGFLFLAVERRLPQFQEAIIGVSFVLAASLAILILADNPHGGEEIQHLLSGQMLFVSWQDILITAPLYVVILLAWFLRPSLRQGIGFYILFALAITTSVRLVGVYVVFASLILPALAAAGATRANLVAWICGALAVISGIGVSVLLNLPSGTAIVVTYTITSLIIFFIARTHKTP